MLIGPWGKVCYSNPVRRLAAGAGYMNLPSTDGYKNWILKKAVPRECGCGCGALIWSLDRKGRQHEFCQGHFTRVENPGMEKIRTLPKPEPGSMWRADGEHWRTARARARSITPHRVCSWLYIGGCKGPIQVAHVDGNFTNQDESNRLALCATHHKLLDNGRIDPAHPVMPHFYVDGSGKRRYGKRPVQGHTSLS